MEYMILPPIVEIWEHKQKEKYPISGGGILYDFGITHPIPNETECCFINVFINMEFEDEAGDNMANFRVLFPFKAKNKGNLITLHLFDTLIKIANTQFNEVYNARTLGTPLNQVEIDYPQYSELEVEIKQTIDKWDRNLRNGGLN